VNIQDRMQLMEAVADELHGTLREWASRVTVEREGHPLEGVELHLVWMEDGTVEVRTTRHGDPILVAQVEITVSKAPEPVNEPTGPELPRTWGNTPAGWFVQTPKGDWLEVISTHQDSKGQRVNLRFGERVAMFSYPPGKAVTARRGTATVVRDEALDVLESSFTTAILDDQPPGQS
jgi:hypothetical protein